MDRNIERTLLMDVPCLGGYCGIRDYGDWIDWLRKPEENIMLGNVCERETIN